MAVQAVNDTPGLEAPAVESAVDPTKVVINVGTRDDALLLLGSITHSTYTVDQINAVRGALLMAEFAPLRDG